MCTKHNATIITPPERTTHGTTVGKRWSTFGQTMGESMQMLQLRVLLRSLRRHEHVAPWEWLIGLSQPVCLM